MHSACQRLLLLILVVTAACVRRPNVANVVPPKPVIQAEADDDDQDAEDDTQSTEFYLRRRVVPGQTTLLLDRYNAAREHTRQMPSVSLAAMVHRNAAAVSSGSWTSLGPGNVGGRTRSLVIHPQNPNIMYAGAVTGGVWRTTDGGTTWTELTDLLPVLNIGALVMDPNNPNILYAGTGEWYKSFPGQGIFKTTDGGDTWNLLPKTGPLVGDDYQYVNRLVMSPTTPNRIYAATWGGVFTSADGGNTWTSTGLTTKQAYFGCQDLVVRTDQTADYLYASCSGLEATSAYTIWRNANASGGAWTQVFSAPFMARTSLAVAPSQQSTIYAMATSNGGNANYQNGLLAVYRSTSNGDSGSWTTQVSNADPDITNTLLLTDVRTVTSAYCNGGALTFATGQGGYDNSLAVDPKDPNRVWAGGVDVFRSDDGGVTWGLASIWQLPYGSSQFAHADRHLFVFHPSYDGSTNQTMFLATDGGVFRTDNARAAVSTGPMGGCQSVFTSKAAIQWTGLNHSYVATQYYHGFSYPGGQAYMGGAQDNSVTRGNDAAGSNGFTYFSTGDGAAVAIDPADANRFFESKENLSLVRSTNGLTTVSSTFNISEPTFPFIAFLAMDPNEGLHLFLGGITNLWRSFDGGVAWIAAAPVEASSSVTSIVVSPFDSNTVLFGTQAGHIYRSSSALSSDGTTAWNGAQPRTGSVSSIAFDPTNSNVIYAVYSSLKSVATDAHVYKSSDGGVSWTPSDGTGATGLPDIPAFRLLVNPYNPQMLFIGTDMGIYVSQDGGATWAHDSSMESVIIEELAIDNGPASNWLFAFTFGRGVYRIPLAGAPNPSCTYSVSPTSISADGYGGIVPVSVSAPPGCPWVGLPGTSAEQFYVQSPAQGSGAGSAYVVVEPNTGTTNLSDQLTIANTVISVNESTVSISARSSNSSSAPVPLDVPGEGIIDSQKLSATPNGPVQSCSGSTGYKTAWWVVTAPASGYLQARAFGLRYDVSVGNSGIVMTAYPIGALHQELACGIVPRDTNSQIDATIQFPVTMGSQYLIDISATGATNGDGGYTVLSVTMGNAPVSLSVTPGTAAFTSGSGGTEQFSAHLLSAPNPAVRWSIAPAIGRISMTGVYTPPASITSAATVTVTATSFADPTKQASATISLQPQVSGVPAVTLVATAEAQNLTIAPNTWIEIKGTNLAPDTRIWQGTDFVNNQLPTQLDGVSVTVDGKPAFVYYISPTQVNVLTPLDSATGPVEVQLTNGGTQAAPVTAQLQKYAPEFFVINGGPYVVGTHLNPSNLIGPASLYPGVTTPLAAGETVVLYGNGFGQTSPAIVNGSLSQSGTLPVLPMITIGGINATVEFAGVISPGLYQFNVVVPPNAPSGDNALVATYNGLSTPAKVLVTVK